MKTLILAAFAALLAVPAPAQGRNCQLHAIVVERLAQGHGETRRSFGLTGLGQLVEVFASDASGTWTITVTSPAGLTCLIASGTSFETLAQALPGQKT